MFFSLRVICWLAMLFKISIPKEWVICNVKLEFPSHFHIMISVVIHLPLLTDKKQNKWNWNKFLQLHHRIFKSAFYRSVWQMTFAAKHFFLNSISKNKLDSYWCLVLGIYYYCCYEYYNYYYEYDYHHDITSCKAVKLLKH